MPYYLKKFFLLIIAFQLLQEIFSQKVINVEINFTEYNKVARNFFDFEYFIKVKDPIHKSEINKYYIEDLKILSIPIFRLKENRIFYDCDSDISQMINFTNNFNNQYIIVFDKQNNYIAKFRIFDTVNKKDSLWFINRVFFEDKFIKNYLKSNNKSFLFGIDDDINNYKNGLWCIKNNLLWKVIFKRNKILLEEPNVWLLNNYDIETIRNPKVIYRYTPKTKKKYLNIKKFFLKKKCKVKSRNNTYITIKTI